MGAEIGRGGRGAAGAAQMYYRDGAQAPQGRLLGRRCVLYWYGAPLLTDLRLRAPADIMTANKPHVIIYTDGGAKPNPGGPGGWAALLLAGEHRKELSGGEAATTNNRMELTAAIMALEALSRPCVVTLYTDSEYLRKGISEWLDGWLRKGWKTANGQPVKNRELWERLRAASERHEVNWRWVRGHAGSPENERVDQLATVARRNIANNH